MSRTSMILAVAGGVLGMGSVALAADADRAYAAELMADAASRTSLAQGGAPGYDGQFYISDAAGNFRLNIGGLVQLRYYANFRDGDTFVADADDDDDADYTGGFDLPRAIINVAGNVISPDIGFKISGDFGGAELSTLRGFGFDDDGDPVLTGSGSGDFNLLEAWVKYSFGGGQTYALAGQFRAPVLFEEILDPGMQMVIERSIVNEYFSPGYTQGLAIGHESDAFRIVASVNDGANSTVPYDQESADVGLTLRADFKISGDWEQFEDMTSFRGSNNAFRIGAGIHWETGGETGVFGSETADDELFLYTIDAGYEGNGWNVFAAFIGAHSESDDAFGDEDDRDDFGLVVQGGVFLADQFELYGRWETLFLDDDFFGDDADDTVNFLTIGGNYYITPESHAAVVSADLIWSFNETAGLIYDPETTGLLGSTDDNEILVRLQFQLMF